MEQPNTRPARGPYRAARSDPQGLTARERCVFGLLLLGLSNRAIARRLCRSERTVEHHVTALLSKLGAASRSELGSLALENWVPPARPHSAAHRMSLCAADKGLAGRHDSPSRHPPEGNRS
jgi:DNA-binding CsgD family transcriptional regulator